MLARNSHVSSLSRTNRSSQDDTDNTENNKNEPYDCKNNAENPDESHTGVDVISVQNDDYNEYWTKEETHDETVWIGNCIGHVDTQPYEIIMEMVERDEKN